MSDASVPAHWLDELGLVEGKLKRPAHKRLALLACLERAERMLTAGELSERCGYPRGSLTAELQELAGLGVVTALRRESLVEHGFMPRDDLPTRGRHGLLYALGPRAGLLIGVAVGHENIRVVVSDSSSRVLGKTSDSLNVDDATPEAILDVVADCIDFALAETERFLRRHQHDYSVRSDQLRGLTVAVPSPVNRRTGKVAPAVLHGLGQGDLKMGLIAHLRRYWQTTIGPDRIFLENDANADAVGQAEFGLGRGRRDFVVIKNSGGIGLGAFVKGELYRGSAGLAGELGHVPVSIAGIEADSDPHLRPLTELTCHCGQPHHLEAYASGRGVIRRFKDGRLVQLKNHPDPVISHSAETLRLNEVLDHEHRMPEARALLDAGAVFGRGIAVAIAMFDPELVIVTGMMARAHRTLEGAIESAVRSSPRPAENPPPEIAFWSPEALKNLPYAGDYKFNGARGALALALRETTPLALVDVLDAHVHARTT